MPKRHFAIQRVHYPWASPGGAEEIFLGEGRGFDPRGTIETPMKHQFFQMIWSHPIEYPIYPWMLQVQPEDLKDSFLTYRHDRWLGSPPSISHENGHGTIPTTRQLLRLHGHLLRKFHWKVSKMNESRMVLNITRPCWTLEKFTPKKSPQIGGGEMLATFHRFCLRGKLNGAFFGGKKIIKVMVEKFQSSMSCRFQYPPISMQDKVLRNTLNPAG